MSWILNISLLIFALPVAAFAVLALLHHRIPRHGDWLATAALGVSLALAVVVFLAAWSAEETVLVNWSFPWLPLSTTAALMGGVLVDRLTAVMLFVVTLVSFLVHLFSCKYMEGDVRYGRYFACLLLFSASMLGLVLANNLLFLFIFWELVGLSSYLLIGHWFEKKSASNAAIKAFITTRIGDVGMFIGILVCYREVGSLEYADLFQAVASGSFAPTWRTAAGLGIFFGAMGKSAQFPLHVWLPDAMEGPTPVSALIHAATMVAAGVYLVGRLLPLFDDTTLLLIAYTGAFTALFAATIALVQDDIKKVLAYSTVSQLGYMTLALGVGGYVSGLFHLTTHAFFKAGLFLGSGAVIHAMHHEQSLQKYGGLARRMPRTAACYLVATLALVGFPGFSGFWSKDAIIADVLNFSFEHGHVFLPFSALTTVLLTAFYMFRQYLLTFTGEPRDRERYNHAHDVAWQMLLPLVVLGALAVVGGGLGGWFGEMNPKLGAAEQVAALTQRAPALEAHSATHHGTHDAHTIAMVSSTLLALLGIALAFLFYFQRRGKTVFSPAGVRAGLRAVYSLLWNKYFLDELYERLLVAPLRALGAFSARFDRAVIDGVVNLVGQAGYLSSVAIEIVDRVVVDTLVVLGVARATAAGGERLSLIQSGYLRRYLELMITGILLLLTLVAVTKFFLAFELIGF